MMSIFSFPVQAQSAQPRNQQLNNEYSKGRPTTNTKKPKSRPRKTATPKPANTATKAPTKIPTQQSTVVSASSTVASQPTQIGLTGTPASTLDVPATLSTSVTSAAYSPTPTPQGMNTIVAQQTKTAGASFLTSTSLALNFSPTPTNFGAPTVTLTFTPNADELTATALALTTTPFQQITQPTASSPFPTDVEIPVSGPQVPSMAKGTQWYWIAAIAISGVILLTLFYLLYKEWKRSST